MLADLPVERVEYRLAEEEQVCPCCGGSMHEMSAEIRRELKHILGQLEGSGILVAIPENLPICEELGRCAQLRGDKPVQKIII